MIDQILEDVKWLTLTEVEEKIIKDHEDDLRKILEERTLPKYEDMLTEEALRLYGVVKPFTAIVFEACREYMADWLKDRFGEGPLDMDVVAHELMVHHKIDQLKIDGVGDRIRMSIGIMQLTVPLLLGDVDNLDAYCIYTMFNDEKTADSFIAGVTRPSGPVN